MGGSQNININGNLEEVDSHPHGWLWGFKTLVGDVAADGVLTARELEWEAEPEDRMECCELMRKL